MKTLRYDPSVVQRLGRIDLIADAIAEGVRQGLHHSRRRGFSTEFSDFRPYVNGDEPRLLDWRLYARTERYFVKRFEAETNIELTLLLDASASMAWRWQEQLSKLEYAVNLLAALACLHIRQQDQVGLLVHDRFRARFLAPRASARQLEEIIALLAGLDPCRQDVFAATVAEFLSIRRHRGVLLVCSDLEEDPQAVAAALDRLGGTDHEVVLFHLLDRHEVTLPFSAATHLEDSESGALLPVHLPSLRLEHAAAIAAFRQHWEELATRRRILYLPVDTGMDYAEALHRFVAAREVRRNARKVLR